MINYQNIFLTLALLIIFSCNNEKAERLSDFKQVEQDFKNIIEDWENCKTKYEDMNSHKVVIDVQNGSGKAGLAKKVSDYLVRQCYDTYYGNWENFNEHNTRIIIYNNNPYLMLEELKDILKSDGVFKRVQDTTKIVDMTLVIGKDYQNFDFYETLEANNE